MSERTLKQLVGALVVAAVAWGVAAFLSGGGGSIGASSDIASFFDGMDPDAVQAVRMTGPDGTTELSRESGEWRVDGWEVDGVALSQFLNVLRLAEVGDLTATNPSNHERMGVADGSAATLEVEVGGETRRLLVGDQGSRFGTAYARLPGADEVYVVEADLRVHLGRSLDEWRDKEVLSLDTARVARVEIERDGDAYTVVRGDSAWTFEDGADADATQVRNVLMELAGVLASGFLVEGDSLLALPMGGSNVAYADDGSTLAEITFGSGEGERWVRAAGDSVVYRLSTFRLGRLAPELEAMRGGS